MTEIEVRSQQEFDDCVEAGHTPIVIGCRITTTKSIRIVIQDGAYIVTWGCISQPHIEARQGARSHVVAWGTSQPHVVAYGNSQPHIVAMDTSQPHVEARDTSQPYIEARDTSLPHIEARQEARPYVEARGTSQPYIVARNTAQPHVVAWDTSQPHILAWDTSLPHIEARQEARPYVEARGTSQPHVMAWDTSQPHVMAWDTSQPHVEASGYAQLSVFGPVVVKAAAKVAVLIRGTTALVEGGQQTRVEINTPEQWCEYYGIKVEDGIATLYKAVDADFRSPHGMCYLPGTMPEATDWDGGEEECGGGLHFAPTPGHARSFNSGAQRYVACPVALADMAVHPDGKYPEKAKAKRVCAPCYEVDLRGKPIPC